MKGIISVIVYCLVILVVGHSLEGFVNKDADVDFVPDGDPNASPDIKCVYLVDANGEITYLDESYAGSTPEEPGSMIVTEYENGVTGVSKAPE